MPNRIIKESICASPNIDQLTTDQESFFYRLLVQCDDYGRMDARPQVIRAKCYPLRIDIISNQMISDYIKALVKAELVQFYDAGGQRYLLIKTWSKHQQIRAKKSKYPDPEAILPSDDGNGNHLLADDSKCPRNPIQSESNQNPNQNPIPITVVAVSENITADIFKFYETEIGHITKTNADGIKDWLDEHPPEHIKEAIKEAVRQGVRKDSYINSILENWRVNGYKSGKPGRARGHPDSRSPPPGLEEC